ncbi:Prolyl oligopeptidase family protein [Flavobacterium johnsoniae]|nr:Prolyl oligopeptidase family protein [Flavobacterium johnsoniae]
MQLATCSLWGQAMQKRALTVEDYLKWGELTLDNVGTKGLWASYTIKYESDKDTLYVKNTKSEKTYSFPYGYKGNFLENNWFICKTPSAVKLLNLKTGQQEELPEVVKYTYNSNTKQLVLLVNRKNKDSEMIVRTLEGAVQMQIRGVTEFLPSPSNELIAFVVRTKKGSTVNILTLSNQNKIKIIASDPYIFTDLVWQGKEKKALAFYKKTNKEKRFENSIYYYNFQNNRLYSTQQIQDPFLSDTVFITVASHKIKISDDLKRVFFIVQKKKSKLNANDISPQVWYGNTYNIYPQEEKVSSFKDTYLAQWLPEHENFKMISNDSLPQFMLTGTQNHAILFNTVKYGPQYGKDDISDFYIYNLDNDKTTLFLRKNIAHPSLLIPSPSGKFISYFRDKNWWIYNIEKNTHKNITQNSGTDFFQNKKQHPRNADAFQQYGWSIGDKEVLLYDTWDLWAFKTDGTSSRRLTKGRETNTKFRHPAYSRIIRGSSNYNGWMLDGVDLTKRILLERLTDYGSQGCIELGAKENKNLLTLDNSHFDQLTQSPDSTTLFYREEGHYLPPRIVFVSTEGVKKTLVQSNPQQKSFYWGRNELISYSTRDGKVHKGLLYYPAQYDPQKKYPMIVYIYEKFSNRLHNYIPPTLYSGIGFNITNFTTQGYFVLTPDISYEIGNPGISATECIISATKEIINKGYVIPNKIGIIGHSFGGYETDYIITQTDLFATAVSGSAVTDLSTFYLSIGPAVGKPDIWRFESQQFRMGKSLFDDRDGYRKNSPIEHVEKIRTPLLSWTGDSDLEVKLDQSVEFFLALRRLEKKHIMLVYPKEGHTLRDHRNQKDLSVRLTQWFAYFLKNEPPAPWINEGLK